MATAKVLKFHPDKCKGHRECEKACSQVHFKSDDGGDKSAIQIIENGGKYHMEVCNQCGLCIDLCPAMALKRLPNGTVTLNKNLCVGCQACVAFCPRGAMRRAEGVIVPFKCISCGKCVEACPEGALELVEMDVEELAEVVYHRLGVGQ